MTLRALIIGGSGLIGRRLQHALGAAATSTYLNRPIPGGVRFDATRMRVSELLRGRRYTHAYVLHGVTNIDACARDPEGTARTNVTAVCDVIDQLVAAGIVPVFASSDGVFDGTRGAWTESDEARPILTYGRHKVAVEAHLARLAAPWAAARIAKVVTSDPAEPGVLGEWMDRLERGVEIQCARDQVFSPVDVEDVVAALIALAANGCTGLYHLGGPSPVARLAFLGMLVDAVRELRPLAPRIVECGLRDVPLAEPRPLDTSMRSDKLAAATGLRFKDMNTVCREAAQRRYGLAGAARAQGSGALA